jgi:hypothetical protein
MECPRSWFFGGRKKSLSASRHRRGDARGNHHSFLKGAGVSSFPHPSCVPGETLRIYLGNSVVSVASLLEGVDLVCGALEG